MRGKHQSRATIVQALIDVGALLLLIVGVIVMCVASVAVVGLLLWKAVT